MGVAGREGAGKPPGRRDILQVAKRAGVSPATVSRVTNGVTTVNKILARKVWKAIAELNYVPNPQARALVSGRSRTLGLLISDVTNPFFPELVQSFEEVANDNDFEVMVGSMDLSKEHARLFIRRLVQRRVEGVAVMTFRADSELLEELVAAHIPMVAIDESIQPPLCQQLNINHEEGIHQAVQHLAVLGHRRIVYASGPSPHSAHMRRKEAFAQAMRQIGLPVKEAPCFADTFEGGTVAAKHFLKQRERPTAMICGNDLMAIGVLRILAEQKIGVPSTMSVIGFYDIHLSRFVNPPLSSILLSRHELACSAFHALSGASRSHPAGDFHLTPVGTSLIVRESTSLPPDAQLPARAGVAAAPKPLRARASSRS